jgi:hypothetical protein
MKRMRAYLGAGAVLFFAAALFHSGLAGDGYDHREALIAESIIGAVLLAGWIASRLAPQRTRTLAIGALAFGLLGTSIGLVTIIIGIGPRTLPDLILHGAMILLLVTGLITAVRADRAVE